MSTLSLPTPEWVGKQGLSLFEDHWVALLGVATSAFLLLLFVANWHWLGDASAHCMVQALSFSENLSACRSTLENAIKSKPTTGIDPTTWTGQFASWAGFNLPRFLVWSDNLAVDMYTVFFLGFSTWIYREVTTLYSDPIVIWRIAITLTCVVAIVGALVDHSENFWMLAHMSEFGVRGVADSELDWITLLSALKFRFFALNVLIALIWYASLRRRRSAFEAHMADLKALTDAAKDAMLRSRLGIKDATRWPSMLNYTSNGTAVIPMTPRVWQALLYMHFMKGALTRSRGLRVSFSTHALDRWLKEFLGAPSPAARQQLLDFLNDLTARGFLAPLGRRYEVVRDEFFDDETVEIPPFGSAPVSQTVAVIAAAGNVVAAAKASIADSAEEDA